MEKSIILLKALMNEEYCASDSLFDDLANIQGELTVPDLITIYQIGREWSLKLDVMRGNFLRHPAADQEDQEYRRKIYRLHAFLRKDFLQKMLPMFILRLEAVKKWLQNCLLNPEQCAKDLDSMQEMIFSAISVPRDKNEEILFECGMHVKAKLDFMKYKYGL